ncbi:mechanosensitive ion channel family protein [Mucilaginibacter daejeonensis]|uniref:mechanosensitive ion channel family protein n=1 Tax=Mucilaginibacter daejeonensis TaxID=398049 RepID=UPI001D176B2D|nr:mechanosensitive ion channel family protein [Mucilaginibacter daejeonensis]UEG54346.1 mechanosensitive ion channel family protein [Mucilaginibacter daejeonensis]
MLLRQLSYIYIPLVAQASVAPSLTDVYNKAYLWLAERGPKIVLAAIVFFAGLWLIKALRKRMTARMLKKQVHSSLQPFFLSLSITALYMVLVIVVMEILDLQLTIFTAIISAATVAAGLALSGTLQNFAGGIMILLLKPFEIDDNIIAQGQDGKVVSIQLFYTVIRTFDNKTVIIPNGKLFNEVIVNVSREGSRRLDIDFKLGFIVDPDAVIATLERSVKAIPDVLPAPDKYIGISQIDFDGIVFTIRVWVKPGNFGTTKLKLNQRIISDLRDAGVKFPGT